MTHRERIVELLRKQPGLDDDEISRLTGIEPRQQVNQICHRLENQGQLKRVPGPAGKIVNYLMDEDRSKVTTDFSPLTSVDQPHQDISSSTVETSHLPETLLILPCSKKKSPCHGMRETGPKITQHLSDDLAGRLSDARTKVRKRADIYETTMVPAWRRYNGSLYDVARKALCKAIDKNLHVLILSGGYGILLANEPIGNYDARLDLTWWPNGLLEETIAAYAKRHRLKRMRAFIPTESTEPAKDGYRPYREVVERVDWRAAGVNDAVIFTPDDGHQGGKALTALLTAGAGQTGRWWRARALA